MLPKPSPIISLVLCFLLIFEQSGLAQVSSSLDLSSYIGGLKSILTQDKYHPLHLRYLGYDAKSNNFKLLLDKGNFFSDKSYVVSNKNGKNLPLTTYDLRLKQETNKLMEYFFIGAE